MGGSTGLRVQLIWKFEDPCCFMLCFTEGLFVLHMKDLKSLQPKFPISAQFQPVSHGEGEELKHQCTKCHSRDHSTTIPKEKPKQYTWTTMKPLCTERKHQHQNLYEHCKRKTSSKRQWSRCNTAYSMETQGKDHQ